MKWLITSFIVASSACTTSKPQPMPPRCPNAMSGEHRPEMSHQLVAFASVHSFEETTTKLKAAIEASPARMMMEIDHEKNASGAGLTLPPTRVFVFGNPKIGTPLMEKSRTVALDLPQKILVYEKNGSTYVVYYLPAPVAKSHGITDPRLEKITGLLDKLAKAASGAGGPMASMAPPR